MHKKGLFLVPFMSLCAGTLSTTWDNTGDTGPDSGNSSSLLPFYTSGSNALFSTINGAYQPVINMDVSLCVIVLCPALPLPWEFLPPFCLFLPPFLLLVLLAVRCCLPFSYDVWVSDVGLCPCMVLPLVLQRPSSLYSGLNQSS